MTYNQSLYTQKDLVDILGLPRQTLSRYLPEDGFFLIKNGSERDIKAYSLNVLPEDWRRQLIAVEMAAQPETPLAVAAKMLPESQVPLKAWQREIRDARLMVLECINRLAPSMGGISKATKEFAARSQNGIHNAEIAALVQKATAKDMGKGVCARTLHTWQKLYKTQGADALAPIGGTPPAWPPWLDTFLSMYRLKGCPSIKLIYDCLTDQGEQLPDLRTVQNWIKRLGKIEANKGRLSMLELKKYRVHSIRKTDNLLPTDVFTADGYSGKFYVQHPYDHLQMIKPELVMVLDVASRMAVGFAAHIAENSFCTRDALKDAISKCGVPAIFYADNGPGFKNKMLNDPVIGLMNKLGISDENSLPGRAWSRGLIERGQGSIWSKYSTLLEAHSSKNSDRHHQRKLTNSIKKDLVEHSKSDKLMTWTELLNWAQNVMDKYNNLPHSGLPKMFDNVLNKIRHRTPAEQFRALAPKTEFYKPDAALLNDIMRARELRTPHNGWIRFENQQYYHRDLENYHGQQVIAEYDPKDISHLWIRNEDEQLICVAKIDGNARDYFPPSKIMIAAEKRAARSIKNLEIKIADKKAELQGQQIIEMSPGLKAELVEFREEFAKPKFIRPESDLEKYKLCLALTEKPSLSPEEQEFYEVFTQSQGFKEGETEYFQREDFKRLLAANQ